MIRQQLLSTLSKLMRVELPKQVVKVPFREEVRVPVEKIVEVEKTVFVDKVVEVDKPVFIDKVVEVEVEKTVFVDKVVEVDKPVFIDKVVEVEVEKVVEQKVFVEIDKKLTALQLVNEVYSRCGSDLAPSAMMTDLEEQAIIDLLMDKLGGAPIKKASIGKKHWDAYAVLETHHKLGDLIQLKSTGPEKSGANWSWNWGSNTESSLEKTRKAAADAKDQNLKSSWVFVAWKSGRPEHIFVASTDELLRHFKTQNTTHSISSHQMKKLGWVDVLKRSPAY